jgi:3-oxoacyl-[acyl-carrier protein] reductase
MSSNTGELHDFLPVNDMTGKTVLVTGAAQGLGRVIARHLGARGVIVGAVDIQDTAETAALINASGGHALALRADVTNPDDMTVAARALADTSGRLDGLVNGAALFTTLARGPFTELNLDEWDRTFAVNVKSILVCTRAVTPYFTEARSGSIVNIGSNVVSYGAAHFLQYVSSKSAIIGMSRSLARELGPLRVRVNTVSPGLVTTEITSAQRSDDYRRRVIDTQCITEPIRPRDVAELVSFLLSDASRYITGQDLLINAGSHMGPA